MARHGSFWEGKCVVVTGASSGIGAAFARHVAALGGRVGLTARRGEQLSALAEEIAAGGGVAHWAAADVTQAQPFAAAFAKLEGQLGPCDVLLANAGIYRKTSGAPLDAAAVADVMNTNVLGVVNSIAAATPGMLARRSGRIGVVSSVAGALGLPAGGAYSASKAAVRRLCQSLRIDLHPHGVRVTALCPGYIDTPLLTDEERKTLAYVMTASQAATRMARAIARGQAESWFPWQTWLPARIAGVLPFWIYRRVMARIPPLEEN